MNRRRFVTASALLPFAARAAILNGEAARVKRQAGATATGKPNYDRYRLTRDRVLEGARPVMSQIRLIETELPLRPMYQGGSDFSRVMQFLAGLNYWLVSLEPNTMDPHTEHIVEVNALFARAD